ncbi:hypothetical protein GF371_01985 [Candidatus Woesearchaeota archaeon]|nr:hypothetical protein [Candidatus Woesearchaeota archaeon]
MTYDYKKAMDLKKYFKKAGEQINPIAYHDLMQDKYRYVIKHFLVLLLLLTVISSVLYIPKFIILPQQFENEFQKFDTFSLDIDIATKEPVNFGLLTIDTTATEPPEKRGIYITNDTVQVQFLPFTTPSRAKTSDFKDLTKATPTIKANLILGTIMLIPYLIFLMWFYHAIKFLLLILLTAAAAIIITRTFRGEIKSSYALKTCFYGSIFLMLELFIQPFSSSWQVNALVPYIIYAIFVIITLIFLKVTEKDYHKYKKKKTEEKKEEHRDIFSGTKIGKHAEENIDPELIRKDIEKHGVR